MQPTAPTLWTYVAAIIVPMVAIVSGGITRAWVEQRWPTRADIMRDELVRLVMTRERDLKADLSRKFGRIERALGKESGSIDSWRAHSNQLGPD
jgi:hypothetical protein